MSDVQDSLEDLRAENAAMLEQLEGQGVDLSRPVELVFLCDMPDEDLVEAAIAALKDRFERDPLPAGAENPDFAVITDEEQSYWSLMFSVEMVLESGAISALEQAVGLETEKLGGDEVTWEFADPRNKQTDADQ